MAKQTKDLKQFVLMGGNRRIDKRHVDRLGVSMALYPDMLEARPILVNERMEVIDGQHRLAAAKKLGIPIWYDVVKGLRTQDAIVLNNNQANWTLLDYARSFSHQGKQAYKEFLRVHEKFPTVPLYTIVRFIGGNAKNLTGLHGTFRSGEFEAKQLVIGEVYLEMLEELCDINPRFGLKATSLAMYQIFQNEKYDHDRMIKKLAIVPESFVRLYGSAEQIMRNLEDMYNYKQQTDILRFY